MSTSLLWLFTHMLWSGLVCDRPYANYVVLHSVFKIRKTSWKQCAVTSCKKIFLFFKKNFGLHQYFLWGKWYHCLLIPLFWTSGRRLLLGFIARVGPSLAYFIAYMQWIFQIHLWCDTYWLLGGQYGSSVVFDPHIFVILHQISELSINAMFPRCLWILTTGCKTR